MDSRHEFMILAQELIQELDDLCGQIQRGAFGGHAPTVSGIQETKETVADMLDDVVAGVPRTDRKKDWHLATLLIHSWPDEGVLVKKIRYFSVAYSEVE